MSKEDTIKLTIKSLLEVLPLFSFEYEYGYIHLLKIYLN